MKLKKSVTIIICKFGEGGVQYRAKSIIEILNSKGYEINLICDYSDVEDVKVFESSSGIHVNLYPIYVVGYNIFLSLFQMLKIYYKLKPDIFFAFSPKANTFAHVAALLFHSKKRISFIDGFYIKQHKAQKKTLLYIKLYQQLLNINYRIATDLIISSNALLNELPSFAKKKSKVIYGFLVVTNGINKIGDKINLPFCSKTDFVFIYNGRLGPEKGVHILIESFYKLLNTYESCRLIVLGDNDNEYAQRIKKRVEELGINEKVYFTGYIKNVSPYLQLSNALVLPSQTESFGYAILEGWASKLPVIASNIEGPAEIIEHGINGLLFEVGNINDLLEKMKFVYLYKKKTELLAENGYNKLITKFTREKYIEELSEIII